MKRAYVKSISMQIHEFLKLKLSVVYFTLKRESFVKWRKLSRIFKITVAPARVFRGARKKEKKEEKKKRKKKNISIPTTDLRLRVSRRRVFAQESIRKILI